MRLLPVSACNVGMKLARNIYSEEGTILLAAGVELNAPFLKRLTGYGIDHLYIQDHRTDDIVIEGAIRDETRIRAIRQIRTTFRKLMEDAAKKKLVGLNDLGKDFRPILESIIYDLSSHSNAMIMLTNVFVTDHYLYQHSLNVCIYAAMLGISYGYSKDALTALALGALLHDIGKTRIPQSMLLKSGKLTEDEFEQMKKHAEYGYYMLKDEPNIPLLSAHCALQHHERIDGSGYPRGIAGDEIHEYARWIGVVDSYDAMTTHRVYRDALLPHQALEVLFAGSGTLYDPDKIALFRDKIALYPIGITVKLATGETAVVVDLKTSAAHRPVVRVIEDGHGQSIVPYEIDLSKRLTIMIDSVNQVKAAQY